MLGRSFGLCWESELLCLVVAVLALLGCSPNEGRLFGAPPAALSSAYPGIDNSAPPASSQTAPEHEQKASIYAAYLAMRMKEAGKVPEYAITQHSDGAHAARSQGGRLRGQFDTRGAQFKPASDNWQTRLDVTAIGCSDALVPVEPAEPTPSAASPNRVTYARRAGKIQFNEAWTSGQPGFEQSFTVSERPCKGRELVIELAAEGLTPALRDGQEQGEGSAVELRDSAGMLRLRYSDLYAYDASGAVLPATMRVTGERIALHLETGNAQWPVVVDPLVVVEEGELSPEFGGDSDHFGTSVALDGDTALVGVPDWDFGANTDQGAAFVFLLQGAVWSWQATLVAHDGGLHGLFGLTVALSGDTALVGAHCDATCELIGLGSPSVYVFVRSGGIWVEQQKLTGSRCASGDNFGSSVALSGDTALVGAPYHDVGPNLAQGSAYIFVRSGSSWAEQQELTGSSGAANDNFGSSVALRGDTALIGAPNHDVGSSWSQGSAYAFVRISSTWVKQQELTGSSGASGDSFGSSVALSGNTALVGARRRDVGVNSDQGSAYVFVRTESSWAEEQELSSSSGASGDAFGSSVALSGDTALVGARHRDVGSIEYQGSAYVFIRIGSTWVKQQELTGSSGASGDSFGSSVALSGNTALVGAPDRDVGSNEDQGSAYVFVRTESSWAEEQELSSSSGAYDDAFGSSVALSGDTALVGAPDRDVGSNEDQGSAYVFVRSSNTWVAQEELTGSSGASGDAFGSSVALSGDTALVGAPGSNEHQGSAYVFVRSGSTWAEQQELSRSSGAANDNFGSEVALSDDTALVGAPARDVGLNRYQGCVYIFVRSESSWAEQQVLTGSSGAAYDFFGSSVALSGGTALVGTPGFNASLGAAYVFVRSGSSWAEQQVLTDSSGVNGDLIGDFFGSSVALSGDTALVGESHLGALPGSAHIFVRSGSTWVEQQEINGTGGVSYLPFVSSVALSGDTALVGAWRLDTMGAIGMVSYTGSAYVFRIRGIAGQPCKVNGDCAGPYFCVDDVCCTTACDGPCEVCSAARGAISDGTCAPKAAGAPGDPVCPNNVQCNGSSGACPVGCTTDAQCPKGTFCAWVACQTKKTVGTVCTNSNECATGGGCVNGVCCNEACSGSCEACNANLSTGQNGVCSPRRAGESGLSACVGNVLCDGLSRACPSGCTLDAHCPSNQYCESATKSCQTKKGAGTPCAASNECTTLGGCVDGVCCNTPCTGLCQACSAETKVTGGDGECGNAKAGTDPHEQCSQDSPTSCGQSGSCDGAGACATYDATTVCGTPTCFGNESRPRVCIDRFACITSAEGNDCGSYRCNPSTGVCLEACLTDNECTSGNFCNPATSRCEPKQAEGEACEANTACASRHCVDGVCCESACSGQCQWCNDPDAPGKCTIVNDKGQPRGDRSPCPGAGTACGGYCDGSQGDGCSFPGSGTTCGAPAICEGDFLRSAGKCDGAGVCLPGTLSACANDFSCDAKTNACQTSCNTRADCRLGAACDNSEGTGTCSIQGAVCQDRFAVKAVDGVVVSCEGYACVNGACQQQCGGNGDCAPWYECLENACRPLPAQSGQPGSPSSQGFVAGGSCDCRVAGRHQRSTLPLMLFTLVAVAGMRRRRAG